MNSTSIVEKLKEVFRHSIIYGLASSLQSILGFVLLPLLTSFYTTEIFGVYSIILLMSALANVVFYLGASSALGRYYYEVDSISYRKRIITTALLITLFGGIVLMLLSVFLSSWVSQKLFDTDMYADEIIYTMWATCFGFLLNLMTLILRYSKKPVMFLIIIFSVVVINFSTTYVFLFKYSNSLMAPIWGLLVANAFGFLILFISNLSLLSSHLNIKYFKMMLSFGLQSCLAGFLFYILDWIDRLIIKDLLNLSEVGIYSFGYKLGSIIQILLVAPFSLVWAPIRMQYAKDSNAQEMTGRIFLYYSFVGTFVILGTILFGKDVMHYFFNNESFSGGFEVFPLIMFALMLYGYQNILDFGIYVNNKLYYYSIAYGIGIFINIGLNYWLIPLYGYLAAAFVTILTYLIILAIIYLVSNKLYRISLDWKRWLILIFLLVATYLLVNQFGMTKFTVKLIFFISLVAFVYFTLLSKLERLFIWSFIVKSLR